MIFAVAHNANRRLIQGGQFEAWPEIRLRRTSIPDIVRTYIRRDPGGFLHDGRNRGHVERLAARLRVSSGVGSRIGASRMTAPEESSIALGNSATDSFRLFSVARPSFISIHTAIEYSPIA
jgi:hypothetical protein